MQYKKAMLAYHSQIRRDAGAYLVCKPTPKSLDVVEKMYIENGCECSYIHLSYHADLGRRPDRNVPLWLDWPFSL